MIWRVILVLLLLGSKGLAFMPRSDCGFPAVSPLVQERDASNGVLVTYTRGRDLGGGLQTAGLPGQSAATAGGIGGLLARTDPNGSAFYHADGLGNVTALINSSNFVVARYLYNPFGQVTAKWGPLADVNEMQFSSMPHHNPSGFSMYLYRAYDPHLQRWLNRDPIGEAGGINLYAYVHNNPINYFDPFGLDEFSDVGLSDGILNAAANRSGMAADLAASNNLNNQNPNSNSSHSPNCPGSGNAGGGSPMYGGTFQVGLSLNGQFGPLNLTGSGGLAFDSNGHFGTYYTGGGGGGVGAGISGGLSFATSNGGNINDLAGPFAYGSGSLGAGLNGTVDGFSGPGSQNQPIIGGGFTIGVGAGGGAAVGGTGTSVYQIW